MYFSSIYNTVLKKLAKNKDENSLKSLTEKLEKNPIYKHQFDILNFVRESKIENNEDLNNLVKTIVRKNHKFIKEKKVTHIDVWKENKKLLEFYNISSLEVIPNVLDKAIDLNINKGLNESALRSFFKDKIKETKEFTKKELIQENFNYIYKYDDKHQFKTNMSIIQFLSENINDKDKIFINESLNKIKATYKNKFKESVGNLYKLRLLTEKFLKEFHLEDEEDFEEFGDEEPDEPKTSPGKKLSLKDLKYIKRITVETPKNFQNPSQIYRSPLHKTFRRIGAPLRSVLAILVSQIRLQALSDISQQAYCCPVLQHSPTRSYQKRPCFPDAFQRFAAATLDAFLGPLAKKS